MNLEKSCVIVKPDGVGKKVIGKIIDRLESEGFQLLAMKMVRPTEKLMEGFYAEHKGRPFFPGLMQFITSGPIVVMGWQGENIIARVRQIIGSTNSLEAAPGTLRKTWGTDQRRNLIHASDSPKSAERELAYHFPPEELLSYDPDHWKKLDQATVSK